MKKLTQIFALFCCVCVFGQNKIAQRIQELKDSKADFATITPLQVKSEQPSEAIRKTVSDAQIATIDFTTVNGLINNPKETLKVNIPYRNQTLTVLLFRATIFAEGFHADTDKQKNISYTPGLYYKGIIEGDSNSLVSFNFFNNELNAVISSSALSNLVIGKIDKAGNTSDYIIYEDQKMLVANDAECHTSDEVSKEFEKQIAEASRSTQSLKCVTTYFEIDNNLFVANGSNTTTTLNWMTSVFNNMQTLYNNSGITVSLKSTYIWTAQDPYEGIGTSSGDYLYKFKEVRPVFDGDVGQLVGIDAGGLGGVSMGIGQLCSTNNYVYSDVNLSYSTVPTYSWTIQVVTHEFGHNLGSRHTHACAWNGNNTAIDNCAPQAIGPTSEGYSCMTTPPTIPSSSTKGTIMSYCHLVSGVGISFNNGFGTQPANAIINFVNGRGCLSTDCVNTCINGVSDINAGFNVGTSTVTVTWTDITSEDAWQVDILPMTNNTPGWTSVSTNSYTETGLTPNTYYRFRVRPNCGSLIPMTREYIFLTAADYCNNITLTDTGGATGEYGDNQSFVRTLIPNLSNNKIRLEFTSFNLENNYDYFFVYDGSSTAATSFNPNGYTGFVIPGPFESTAADGALTIRFFSDGGVTAAGWEASTSCITTLGLGENNYIDYSYYPNPTNGLVTVQSKGMIEEIKVYNVEGRLLYDTKVNNLTTNVDLSSFATGAYFFKMKTEGQIVNFKIMKQ
ncbi:M12 family metallo-peptidase [Flavobacterium sp.]|uniref:M12 family metallo-peptidase n=1 Tax=Flavobacterium sp. TaxID=239 RepID=UPI0028BDBE08|nr:M12 family metallo-peptidase [Flavobacterium sp.]